jgi:hypothetical protein
MPFVVEFGGTRGMIEIWAKCAICIDLPTDVVDG